MRDVPIVIYRALKRAYGPQYWWPADTKFEVIVGAILTQNTAWINVERALVRLKEKKLLFISAMSKIPIRHLADCLVPAGYFNIKAKRLKNFLSALNLKYRGSLKLFLGQPIPKLREELLSINGIGPETADSIVLYAANKPIFVVDAYTKRIFSRIGMIKFAASYGEIQQYFMNNLPKSVSLFNEFHALIVEHAKRICKNKPLCRQCVLRNQCQYFNSVR